MLTVRVEFVTFEKDIESLLLVELKSAADDLHELLKPEVLGDQVPAQEKEKVTTTIISLLSLL